MSSPNTGPLNVLLLSSATADETFSQPIDVTGRDYVTIYYIGAGTISGGALVVNECAILPATGTPASGDPSKWSAIPNSTVTASELSDGAVKAVHLPAGAYGLLQQRISTAIAGGGSVTAILVAH